MLSFLKSFRSRWMIAGSLWLWALLLVEPGHAQLVRAKGSTVMKKVVAAADNVSATASPGGSPAFELEVHKHYFVLEEGADFFKITDQQSGGRVGYVARKGVIEWNTREGLFFQKSALALEERPKVKVWADRGTIEQYAKTGNKERYPPTFVEEEVTSRALPETLLPYPVLSSVQIPTVSGEDKKIYKVLVPAFAEGTTLRTDLSREQLRATLASITFCVVFDSTSSMAPFAEAMAATVEELLRGLDLGAQEVNVGFVFFRDAGDPEPFRIANPAPLDAAVGRLREAALTSGGGSDAAEPVLDALVLAASEFKWSGDAGQAGGEKKVAIVVLNDDAKPTTIGLSPKVGPGLSVTEVAAMLSKQFIHVYALQAGEKDLGNLQSTLVALANATDGEFYPYNDDAMRVSRSFGSAIKGLIAGSTEGAASDAERVAKTATLPADRSYTVLPLKALNAEDVARLKAVAGEFKITEGGLVIREGWMFEQDDLYREQVLVEKETIENLVKFFSLLADSSIDCADLKRSVTQNLKTMLGEDIDPKAELQELIEKKLGLHFQTSLLAFSLEYLCGLTPKERLDLQGRIGEAAGKLSSFLETSAPVLEKNPQVWMEVSLLP